jgi:galactofuranose transport system substrate-binding protein
MKLSRRTPGFFAMLTVLALLGACAKEDRHDRIVLGFSQIGAESEWRTANTESIKSAATMMNIDLRFADAQQKQENQIKALRSFIAQKVDVIAFSPVVETGWDTVLQEARAAKIPVILTDRSVTADPSLYAGFIGSDFTEEGRKAGRWVAERFKDGSGEVRIVELQGTMGAGPAIDRKKGFEEVIASNPRLKIVRSQSADFTRAKGKEVMEAFLKAETGKIDVLYAHNDDMAIGAIQAIEEAGLRPGRDIAIVSIDAVRGAFQAMIAGKLNATIECNPLLGPQLMTSVTEVMAGRTIPRRILVDEQVFTMETAKQHIQSRKY